MINFSDFLFESKSLSNVNYILGDDYYISFEYKGKKIKTSESKIFRNVFKNVVDWLYKNGYKFDEEVIGRKLFKKGSVPSNYEGKGIYYIPNTEYAILCNQPAPQSIKYVIIMLTRFGVDSSTINIITPELESDSRFGDESLVDEEIFKDVNEIDKLKKMNFLVACQFVLKQNDNRPMNSHEIWEEIKKQNLVNTNGLTPWDTINAKMILSSINTTAKGKKKNSIFQIIEGTKPYKFILLNPDNIQNVPDEDLEEIIDGDYDVDDVENFSKRFGIPTDFKASQSQEEKESPKKYIENPFRQSICILGKSGAGKSWTIDDILDKSNHEYEFIIPSASTTGLLSQFSPSAKEGRGGYIPSRLGKLIENAYKNNSTLYTVVFDECHKSNIIEMINDELLQAISTERNKNRFISLDDETSELYPSKILDRRGNIEITDNLGFIFISSNARVISGNDDFFNRVDLVEITKESRDSVKTIEDLNRLRISDTDKKYELVSKIMSESKR